MKIVISWTHIAGYSAACWRTLAARPGIDLHVICFRPETDSRQTRFHEGLLRGVSHEFLSCDEIARPQVVAALVAAHSPDVVLVSGWAYRCFRALAFERRLSAARFILAMDTPWRGDLRQQIGRYFLRPYARRMSAALVAGDRARHYARRLGVPDNRIHSGLYAYDHQTFNDTVLHSRVRTAPDWPQRFLFVGRYVPEKSIDILIPAYEAYRRQSAAPWPLTCCGMGELRGLLSGVQGITDMGFVDPADQASLFAEHGVLVLPSRYEPWGVVVAEAMATAMPVISTTACGANNDLMRPFKTGLEIPSNNAPALTAAFAWMESHRDHLPELGHAAMQTARRFGADRWAERVESICRSLGSDARC